MAKHKQAKDPRYELFVHHYFFGKPGVIGNATQSAIAAEYAESTARKKAPMWVGPSRKRSSNKAVWDLVAEQRKRIAKQRNLSEAEIITQYARFASFDTRKLYDEDGRMRPIHLLDDDTAACVDVSITLNADGEVIDQKVTPMKASDRRAAMDSLAKINGMFHKDNEQKRNQITYVETINAVGVTAVTAEEAYDQQETPAIDVPLMQVGYDGEGSDD